MRRSAVCLLAAVIVMAGSSRAGDPKKDDTKLTKDEQFLLEKTNEERKKEKLPPLKINATLLKVARAHAANMAKQHQMEHVLDGKGPPERVEQAGYDYRSVGENLANGDKGAPLADVIKGWMNSKEHREHILSPKFDEIGIGLAVDDKGESYITQVFGKERAKN
jgi:uncharacterized protein YkwD